MGSVYILTNEAMPDLIKIGCTTRTAEERAQELYTTEVPHPFSDRVSPERHPDRGERDIYILGQIVNQLDELSEDFRTKGQT